ncbi:hypothetical protein JB92DRAFT_3106528 [Gautieria morchelliformis]|nr:hypothetical protein JB92DRAFT_3106528 [Gautieria morchelliformis]
MRGRKQGVVGMIGSRGSDMIYPGAGAYTSSKAALAAICHTLAKEVEPFNIGVTCIEPGDFRTEVFSIPIVAFEKIPDYEPVLSPTFELVKGFLAAWRSTEGSRTYS